MSKILAFSVGGMCLAASACSHVEVQPIVDNDPASHVGLPYALQMTTFKIQLVRKVVKCGPRPEILVTAKIGDAELREDASRRYVIDPDSLSTMFKTGSVKLGYDPNGTVTTFNAAAEDRSAQIISNVAAVAVKLASFAAAGGIGPAGVAEACPAPVLEALGKLPEQQKALKSAAALVEAKTGELKAVQTKVSAMGGAVDAGTQRRFSAAIDALAGAVEAQQAADEALSKTLKIIAISETHYWPQDASSFTGTFRISPSELRRLVSVSTNPADNYDANALTVFTRLAPIAPVTYHYGTSEKVDASLGIPFRRPIPGRLSVCEKAACGEGGALLAEVQAPVSQFGETYYLPCVSRPFTSVECSFELTSDGKLKSIGTMQKAAALEGATAAAGAVIEGATNVRKTLSGRDTARLQAKTAALKAQADYAAALAAQEANPQAVTAAATAAIKAETDLTLARIAQLQAEAALQAALAAAP